MKISKHRKNFLLDYEIKGKTISFLYETPSYEEKVDVLEMSEMFRRNELFSVCCKSKISFKNKTCFELDKNKNGMIACRDGLVFVEESPKFDMIFLNNFVFTSNCKKKQKIIFPRNKNCGFLFHDENGEYIWKDDFVPKYDEKAFISKFPCHTKNLKSCVGALYFRDFVTHWDENGFGETIEISKMEIGQFLNFAHVGNDVAIFGTKGVFCRNKIYCHKFDEGVFVDILQPDEILKENPFLLLKTLNNRYFLIGRKKGDIVKVFGSYLEIPTDEPFELECLRNQKNVYFKYVSDIRSEFYVHAIEIARFLEKTNETDLILNGDEIKCDNYFMNEKLICLLKLDSENHPKIYSCRGVDGRRATLLAKAIFVPPP